MLLQKVKAHYRRFALNLKDSKNSDSKIMANHGNVTSDAEVTSKFKQYEVNNGN